MRHPCSYRFYLRDESGPVGVNEGGGKISFRAGAARFLQEPARSVVEGVDRDAAGSMRLVMPRGLPSLLRRWSPALYHGRTNGEPRTAPQTLLPRITPPETYYAFSSLCRSHSINICSLGLS